MNSETRTVRMAAVAPLHSVRDANKLAAMIDVLSSGGSLPMPVVVEYGDGYLALTGSHRYAAHRAVDAEYIDVIVVTGDELDDCNNTNDYRDAIAQSNLSDDVVGEVRAEW